MTGLLLLALALGGAVGWERERHDHPAGLRTHILVCVGAALITLVDRSETGIGGRIAAQIVTGVGFLGAGTIIRSSEGFAVRGLTTAASVWTTAGVGIAVGYGGVPAQAAAVATLLCLFTLTTVNHFEEALLRSRRRQRLSVIFAASGDVLTSVQGILQMLQERDIKVRNFQMEKMGNGVAARFWLRLSHGQQRDALDERLSVLRNVLHYDWDE